MIWLGFFLLKTIPTFANQEIPMYRMYNPNSGKHFYTRDTNERKDLMNRGWLEEGIGWYAPSSGTPVYRLYNTASGNHLYTMNSHEKDSLDGRNSWRYEGIGWYSGGNVPLHRNYNPNVGNHHFTTSKYESDAIVQAGWHYENVAWYGTKAGTNVGTQQTPNALIEKVIGIGMSYVNNGSYVYGAGRTTASINARQFDCSSFVNWCFVAAGVNITDQSRSFTWTLDKVGRPIAYNQKQRGDILVMYYPGGEHAAIYLGNNQILHCSPSARNKNIDVDSLSVICPGLVPIRAWTWEQWFSGGSVRRVF
jgi:cell wall-associated NlpC family hydrolase